MFLRQGLGVFEKQKQQFWSVFTQVFAVLLALSEQ